MMEPMIYTGKDAQTACERILENVDYMMPIEGYESNSAGYWEDDKGIWVAYDNTDGCCFVEEFMTKEQALKWLND